MTVLEAASIIDIAKDEVEWNYPIDYYTAFDMAQDVFVKCNEIISVIRSYKEHSNRTAKESEDTIDEIEAILRGWRGVKHD